MRRYPAIFSALVCSALLLAPAGHAAPVAKTAKAKTRVVCVKRVARGSHGRGRVVLKVCHHVTVKTKANATPKTAAPAPAAAVPAPATPSIPAPDGLRAGLRDCANSERAKVGLPPVSDDPALDLAAQGHAVDMQVRNYFDHDTPDGKTPWDRIRSAISTLGEKVFDWMGENIAAGFDDAPSTCVGWMNSPGHRANILNAHYDKIGTGWIDGYAVQDFGGS